MFSAIARFFRNLFARWTGSIDQAADAQFTKDTTGVALAYDLEADQKAKEFEELLAAVGTIETNIESKKKQVEKKEEELADAQLRLNGCVNAHEAAEKAGNKADLEETERDGARISGEIDTITAALEKLNKEIKEDSDGLAPLEQELKDLKDYIAKLPQEKAEAIAQRISDEQRVEMYNRINNIRNKAKEKSPLAAVRQANDALHGQATVAGRITGKLNTKTDDKYRTAGKTEAASNRFQDMLKAKKAEQGAKTGETTAPATEDKATTDRPRI